jgi:hypothetical protein
MSDSKGLAGGRIYVYSAPGYDSEWVRTVGGTTLHGRGRYKVGYTGRPDPQIRIKEQTGTLYPGGEGIVIHLDEPAVKENGEGFDDHSVHKVLDGIGVLRKSEVIEATLSEIKAAIAAVRSGRTYDASRTEDFKLRPEQLAAVEITSDYFRQHSQDKKPPRFLWNAKMRFGKTFTTYQLANRMKWKRILVLTYKPAVRNSWKDDLANHVDFSDWLFADREQQVDPTTARPVVWFASFQDLLGTNDVGAVKQHNELLHIIEWDCVVLDEYHFGAWQGAAKELTSPATILKESENHTRKSEEKLAESLEEVESLIQAGTPRLYSTMPDDEIKSDLDVSQLRLSSKNFLYLSGTPFRALTEGEFNEDAIFNWTYPQEQEAKNEWGSQPDQDPERNPYVDLPEMQMFTYALSEMTQTGLHKNAEGMFDLSGFFAAKKVGSEYHFEDPRRVTDFLNMIKGKLSQDALTKLLDDGKPRFPFANDMGFGRAIDHTVWLLPTVASAHAMKSTLETDAYFKDFLVHVAAGTSAKIGAEAKIPVERMLSEAFKHDKQTITLSVGKLMTGVTVPQWGAILILRSLKSPESYFQASFRVQSPWTSKTIDGKRTINKQKCYVFDFDPNRALSLIYQYGTKLAGDNTKSKTVEVIGELIEYLPIFTFDGGRMETVDARSVMDWGTSGAGAAMLTKRWSNPRLIDLSEGVLNKLLSRNEVVDQLMQMEDFRRLREDISKIISQSQKIRSGKKPRVAGQTIIEDPETLKARREKRDQVSTLRDKLLKFIQTIPVFMYLTDFREEALVDVIESLDSQLFERVTGLTVDDFRNLSEIGVFHSGHMNEAIWQFRLFEEASLDYLGLGIRAPNKRLGLWDKSLDDETN